MLLGLILGRLEGGRARPQAVENPLQPFHDFTLNAHSGRSQVSGHRNLGSGEESSIMQRLIPVTQQRSSTDIEGGSG